jgi:hypothetical protein
MPVVGFINGASPAPRNFAAFVQGLKEAGFDLSEMVNSEMSVMRKHGSASRGARP